MNHFTIRDIENLCRIKAHTLRIWEQRYKFFVPKRKKSQHRIYDNDDLKKLLRISFLYHNGYKISKIAELSTGQIHQLVEESGMQNNNQEIFIHQLIEAGLDFDKEKFEIIVNCLTLRIGMEKCITEVFYPFLQRIGLLWMTNNVIPAQEHFVSQIIRNKIIVATDGLEVSNNAETNVIVFSPTGEFHEIPILVVNYFLRKQNNRTVYFGTNVSIESLNYYMQYHSVTHLYAHIITHLNNSYMDDYISDLCKKFPDKKIFISGPAVMSIEKKPANLQILSSVAEMISFTKATAALI